MQFATTALGSKIEAQEAALRRADRARADVLARGGTDGKRLPRLAEAAGSRPEPSCAQRLAGLRLRESGSRGEYAHEEIEKILEDRRKTSRITGGATCERTLAAIEPPRGHRPRPGESRSSDRREPRTSAQGLGDVEIRAGTGGDEATLSSRGRDDVYRVLRRAPLEGRDL